ncbi:MAG TPA: type II toxin-antitoxin system PemK/MazF family toxin [Alphaproteobacteria bacterium]|nr:type II toxin-antitoxin system PemK/MazF family toxin [Alphaproteobacteria bacterium]
MAAYQPDRGHFVHLDFTPHAGTEQAGRRPALVVSSKDYNIATGLMFACPITNQLKDSVFEFPIPPGAKITGAVLANQMRCLDWLARNADFHSEAPRDLVLEVIAIVEAILVPE